jgi:hypothetical protein
MAEIILTKDKKNHFEERISFLKKKLSDLQDQFNKANTIPSNRYNTQQRLKMINPDWGGQKISYSNELSLLEGISMAIEYKKLVEKLENEPLNEYELEIIKFAEEAIDSQIMEKFGNSNTHSIYIPLNIIDFSDTPRSISRINDMKVQRINKMKKELIRRYNESGWDFHFTDEEDVLMRGKSK